MVFNNLQNSLFIKKKNLQNSFYALIKYKYKFERIDIYIIFHKTYNQDLTFKNISNVKISIRVSPISCLISPAFIIFSCVFGKTSNFHIPFTEDEIDNKRSYIEKRRL